MVAQQEAESSALPWESHPGGAGLSPRAAEEADIAAGCQKDACLDARGWPLRREAQPCSKGAISHPSRQPAVRVGVGRGWRELFSLFVNLLMLSRS